MPANRASKQPPSWAKQVALIVGKELRHELATGELATVSSFFALLVVVLASLTLHGGEARAAAVAPAVIWIAVAFAGVLALGKSWQREREDRAFDGLLLTPLSRGALFLGKALAQVAFLLVVLAVVAPAAALFFDLDPFSAPGGRAAPPVVGGALVAALALPGLAATGTLFGAMTVRTRARELLLAVVLFPLLSPTLLAAVTATQVILEGAPLAELAPWLALLALFDVVAIGGGLAMFGTLVDG